MTSLLLAQAGGAGGAPLADLVGGTIVGGAMTLIVFAIGGMHRTRRIKWLGALAAHTERVSGLPRWAALPAAVGGASLQLALFGFWWDVATHIDKGRDAGPFGTPAHWPILIGLFGIALAGFLAVVLGCDDDEPSAVKLRGGWSAPLGGILLLACGAFALMGFPLDDTWHRLFGQDVTLWGPTHVLMIASASLATLAVWTLLVEGRRSARRRGLRADPKIGRGSLIDRVRGPMIAGGFLIGLSSLQGEFDFGVPQFSLILHPVMLMVAAACGLVTARIVLGRFGALKALGFYLLLRVIITGVVDGVFGLSTMHFPLYAVEAALVELVAWRMGTDKPLRFGVVAGALVGTIGLAAEWAWSHIWMPIPWPSSILPEAAILGLLAALAAGALGAYLGGTLRDPDTPVRIGPAWAAGLAGAVIVLCVAYPIPQSESIGARADVTLHDVAGAGGREVQATVRILPAAAARNTAWLTATAWQGGGLVVNRLQKVGDGVYRTTQALPVHDKWKALIRISDGRSLEAIPIYMPADPQIPAKGVAAPAHFERTFVSDKSILQREAKGGSPVVVLIANLVLLLIIGSELAALAWGLTRMRRISVPVDERPERFTRTPARPVVTA
ncbi:MAG: hypothetical protein QOG68_2101 [Solirubrobacteraceae bacterium]|nr:hypothetical protein [Solirubrobacteraceae bacterium]